MRAERAHTFLATPSRMQNHRSKERRAAQRRLYSRISTLKRRTSCGRGTPCVNTFSEAIASIMLRETPDDRRVAAPGLHLTHGRVTIVVVWKRFVKKMNKQRLSEILVEVEIFSQHSIQYPSIPCEERLRQRPSNADISAVHGYRQRLSAGECRWFDVHLPESREMRSVASSLRSTTKRTRG